MRRRNEKHPYGVRVLGVIDGGLSRMHFTSRIRPTATGRPTSPMQFDHSTRTSTPSSRYGGGRFVTFISLDVNDHTSSATARGTPIGISSMSNGGDNA
jgi:hypothetical protein